MHKLSYRGSWEAPSRIRRSAVAQQTPDRGRRLVGDAVDAVCQNNRVIVHRRQAASYQTTCNPLKELDFVGADRAAFRLSAKRPVHPTHMQWLKYCICGQVRSHQVCCATALRRRRSGASRKNCICSARKTASVQQVKWCSIKVSLPFSPAALSTARQATTTPTA